MNDAYLNTFIEAYHLGDKELDDNDNEEEIFDIN